ncbi:MAG: hypothetical protein QM489_06295 [Candidatus Izemoplasma sp.]
MFDNIKLNRVITVIIVFILLLISRIVIGLNVFTIQFMLITIIWIVVLVWFQTLLLKLKKHRKSTLIKFLTFVVVLLIVLAIINFIIEYKIDSVLIYRKTIPGILLFIYASTILIWSFLLIDCYVKQRNVYIALQSIVIGLVIAVGIFDMLLIFIGGSSVTEVDFEDPNITLYLVEDTFIFSSNHYLYQKTLPFYGAYLEPDQQWSCHDGCITEHPEVYTWTWIDDQTLVISYSAWSYDITYYLPE